MGLLDRFRRRVVQARYEARIEFLGEQDGAPEAEFKSALQPILSGSDSIKRAYLARVGFQPQTPSSVTLCLAGVEEVPPALLRKLTSTFAKQFNSASALDILRVSAEQEVDLRRICVPFYERAG